MSTRAESEYDLYDECDEEEPQAAPQVYVPRPVLVIPCAKHHRSTNPNYCEFCGVAKTRPMRNLGYYLLRQSTVTVCGRTFRCRRYVKQ